jgi:hypothetical protein
MDLQPAETGSVRTYSHTDTLLGTRTESQWEPVYNYVDPRDLSENTQDSFTLDRSRRGENIRQTYPKEELQACTRGVGGGRVRVQADRNPRDTWVGMEGEERVHGGEEQG